MQNLLDLAVVLENAHDAFMSENIQEALSKLDRSIEQIGRSWSGSNVGYHSYVYYDGFQIPPPGAHFSAEWGLDNAYGMGSTGNWTEYTFAGVKELVYKEAGDPDLNEATACSDACSEIFISSKAEALSTLQLALAEADDAYLADLKEKIEQTKALSIPQLRRLLTPSQATSRDATAMYQGIRIAPHQDVFCALAALRAPALAAKDLAKLCAQAGSHGLRKAKKMVQDKRVGTNIFIGHGRSRAWKNLKEFLTDRLRLPFDEFNRVPIAGITNIARLAEMLDAAAFAFIVLTAEDEQTDGTVRARMNVIHEAGLFQGRLGFTKAIIILEEGCEEFSNIQGLGQIRFPAGDILAKSEEIRGVLEREGIIS